MKLFAHQQKILDQFPAHHTLIWSTGAGKTLALIALANKAFEDTLVICPKSIKKNWELNLIKEGGVPSWRVMTKEEFRRDHKTLPCYPAVIIDEVHYFLGMKSAMAKSLLWYFKKWDTKYRWGASATVFRSSPWDVYRLLELMGQRLHYWRFDQEFFDHVRMGLRIVPVAKRGKEAHLAALASRVGSIVRLEDCLDVPEQNFLTEYFDLTSEQEKAIEQIPDPLAIVRFTKEHQICGGTLKGNEYEPAQTFKSDKLDRLVELVAENDKSIVVCRYNHELAVLAERLAGTGRWLRIINGAVTGEERYRIISELQASDNYCLLVNAAVSEGWELPACPLMIFYSYDFSLVSYIQMLGRIQRINHIKKNTYLSLVTKGTIDEDIFKTITITRKDFHLAIYEKRCYN